MSWVELTIRTVSDGIELLCAELTEADFDSFVIDDQEEFQEFLETSLSGVVEEASKREMI